MGRERACERLMFIAKDDRDADREADILCRMVFAKRGTNQFREPWIGLPSYLAGTDNSSWPLEPIEIVDGVPFLITRNDLIHAELEPSDRYLNYCETNCDWNATRFFVKSKTELQDSLNKLLASSKWKRPLNEDERDFLTRQIRTDENVNTTNQP